MQYDFIFVEMHRLMKPLSIALGFFLFLSVVLFVAFSESSSNGDCNQILTEESQIGKGTAVKDSSRERADFDVLFAVRIIKNWLNVEEQDKEVDDSKPGIVGSVISLIIFLKNR